MNKHIYLFVISATLILFVGCASYTVERKQVADLMDQLDEAKKAFARSHPDSIGIRESQIKDRLTIISEHYTRNRDTMGLELGILLGGFKKYRKMFKGLSEKRTRISEELELAYSQLRNLDADLKNGSLDKNEATNYINEERLATNALTSSIFKLDTLLHRGVAGYHRYVPRIDSVMNSLGAPK